MLNEEIMDLEQFEELWWLHISPGVYCSKRDVILHRACPVDCANQGLDETVHLTPAECFECKENIRNGGICDPI